VAGELAGAVIDDLHEAAGLHLGGARRFIGFLEADFVGNQPGKVTLSSAQWAMLIGGIDLKSTRPKSSWRINEK